MKYTQLYEVEKDFLKVTQLKMQPTELNGEKTALLWKIINTNHECKFDVFEETKQALKKFE